MIEYNHAIKWRVTYQTTTCNPSFKLVKLAL